MHPRGLREQYILWTFLSKVLSCRGSGEVVLVGHLTCALSLNLAAIGTDAEKNAQCQGERKQNEKCCERIEDKVFLFGLAEQGIGQMRCGLAKSRLVWSHVCLQGIKSEHYSSLGRSGE